MMGVVVEVVKVIVVEVVVVVKIVVVVVAGCPERIVSTSRVRCRMRNASPGDPRTMFTIICDCLNISSIIYKPSPPPIDEL